MRTMLSIGGIGLWAIVFFGLLFMAACSTSSDRVGLEPTILPSGVSCMVVATQWRAMYAPIADPETVEVTPIDGAEVAAWELDNGMIAILFLLNTEASDTSHFAKPDWIEHGTCLGAKGNRRSWARAVIPAPKTGPKGEPRGFL